MSQDISDVEARIPDALDDIANLVRTGQVAKAKREMGKLITVADSPALHIIGRCCSTLQAYPYEQALEKLRAAWDRAPSHYDRALIAACVPQPGEGQHRPQVQRDHAALWTGQNRHDGPAPVDTHVDRSARTGNSRTAREARQARQTDKFVHAYHTQRAGVDDEPWRERQGDVYGSGLDYDKAARPNVRGLVCLFCRSERANADRPEGRTDDGLCAHCRTPWRTGLPALPADATYADMIAARCAWLVAHNPRPRGLLLSEWHTAPTKRDQDTITAWVKARAAREVVCTECLSAHDVKNGLCKDCRPKDNHAQPATTEPEPADEPAQSSELVTLPEPGEREEEPAEADAPAPADA